MDNKGKDFRVLANKMAIAARTNSKRVHVITRENNHWAVKKEGNLKATFVFRSLDKAIEAASKIVEKGNGSSVVLHDSLGKIEKVVLQG